MTDETPATSTDATSGNTWRDEAVDSDHDTLGRDPVAHNMAIQIRGLHSWKSSVVFGLTGSWGGGKTSMINMITKTLSDPVDQNEPWLISTFTPWAASDTETLVREFFSALSDELPPKGEARKKLLRCAEVASPLLKAIPWAGAAAGEVAQTILKAQQMPAPWQTVFDEACQELRELGKPLLIVADDVDRLHTDELLTLLKVVRLLGRFPGVFYLLAYDEDTLLSNLTAAGVGGTDGDRARLFMEKIVQYQMPVPPLTETKILELINTGLVTVFEELGRPVSHGQYGRLSGLSETLELLLTTPRAIGRFVAHARMHLSLLAVGEINDIDLVLLTLVRTQLPELYREMPKWSRELTGGARMRAWIKQPGGSLPEPEWDQLLVKAPEAEREEATAILHDLFPAMRGSGSTARAKGISDPDYFHRYFAQGIPQDDVSDLDMATLVIDAQQRAAESGLTRFLIDEEDSRVDVALRKLIQATLPENGNPLNEPTPALFQAVMAAVPHLGIDGLLSPRDRARNWMSLVLRELAPSIGPDSLSAILLDSKQLPTAVHVTWRAARRESNGSYEVPAEVTAVAKAVVKPALDAFFEELRLRDDASQDDSFQVGYLNFAMEFASHDEIATRLWALIDAGDVTVEDFAARCVITAEFVAAEPIQRLHGFDSETFSKFVPANDPFFRLPEVVGVDRRDLSWSNRRAFSHSRYNTRPGDPDDDAF